MWALLAGIAGLGVTLYDRSNAQNAINSSGLASGLLQIGWGLNLALGASISMAAAAFVYLLRLKPTALTAVPASPPPLAPPPVVPVPTPPPE